MNTRITLRANANDNILTSNKILSEDGGFYYCRIARDFLSGQILDDANVVVAEVTGNTSEHQMLQAIKNYLITELDCKFAVDNIPRDAGSVSIALPVAQKQLLTFSEVFTRTGISNSNSGAGNYKVSYGAYTTDLLVLSTGSAANIPTDDAVYLQTELRLLPGLEAVVVTGTMATGLEVEFVGVSNPTPLTIPFNTLIQFPLFKASFSAPPVSGNYKFNFNGNDSSAIAYNTANLPGMTNAIKNACLPDLSGASLRDVATFGSPNYTNIGSGSDLYMKITGNAPAYHPAAILTLVDVDLLDTNSDPVIVTNEVILPTVPITITVTNI